MKSFNQFLQESYLNEDEVQGRLLTNRGTAQNFTNPKRIPFTATDPTPTPASRRLSAAGSPERPRTSPGQMEIPLGKPPKGTNTTVPGSGIRGENGTGGEMVKAQEPGKLARSTGRNPSIPDAMLRGAQDAANKPPATSKPPASTPSKPSSSTGNPPALSSTNARRAAAEAKKAKASAGSGPSGKAIVTPAPSSGPGGGPGAGPGPGGGGPKSPVPPSDGPKPPTGPKLKVPAGAKKALRIGGKLLGPAAAALDVADERSKGSGWLRSLAKGATVAAGGALGGAAGTGAGPVGTFAGATGGAMAASKAFDVAAGANAKERKAIATANRKGQAGGAIKGIGGKTTFDTNKNTITTGTGAQRKTAQLGKTSVITGPGGKQEVGNLAYKGGKAVYKRSDTKSLAQTSSNPLERIGRSLFAGAYKKSDAANAAKKLATARQSDTARNKALGVKFGPGK